MFMRLALLAAATALLAACGIASDTDPTQTPASDIAAGGLPAETATSVPTVEPTTTLLFTGDIIPARCTDAAVTSLGGDWTLPFQAMHDTLTAADITIGALDSTISDAVVPTGCIETFSLGGVAAVAGGLKYAGYDVIAHAANHIKDCGAAACGDQAMLDTATNLSAAGIQSVGSGADLAEARRPVVIERNGVYFAFLAYDDIAAYYHATEAAAGSAPMDPATVGEDIANARKVANVVVVMPHWGSEYTADPSERQSEFARAAAAAGADLVIGNHPHWVQAHEQIGSTFVAYALGNFVFDQDWSLETQQGAILQITFSGTRVTGTKYTPIHIYDEYQPRVAEGDEAVQILDRIETASAAIAPTPIPQPTPPVPVTTP
ncbi:MAG: CapA family protein [Chloroflexi bacterium]|nr:CapA family protein [Chloroflexota bacterium]